MTPYHAKYYAHELTRTGGEGVDRLGRALFDATVTLNPHQIEAALFALRSPLSKGALLADEVGLGKTIEAGLVLCQSWAEGRRRLLIITPASLRKQWALELHEKFNLPSVILDAHSAREFRKAGHASPFEQPQIIICSYHYAARMAAEIQPVPWDLVVMDEAHKLRNCHRESNRLGQAIKQATADRKKILLTATPLQNSLVELYGLASLIDERLFGDLPTFRTQFANAGGDLPALRERLATFCHRTLRSQVLEYVKYTARQLLTQPFTPSDDEHRLYEAVSTYLQRDDCYALPQRQRHLIILLVRKVLSSSPRALAGTLEMMRDRLLRIQQKAQNNASLFDHPLRTDRARGLRRRGTRLQSPSVAHHRRATRALPAGLEGSREHPRRLPLPSQPSARRTHDRPGERPRLPARRTHLRHQRPPDQGQRRRATEGQSRLSAFSDLRKKLAELFQLDAAAELDFGIYRILNARRVEIEGFLDSLEPQVDAILAEALQSGGADLKAELEKVEAGLRAGGFDEAMIATAPKVRELREKIAESGSDPAALAEAAVVLESSLDCGSLLRGAEERRKRSRHRLSFHPPSTSGQQAGSGKAAACCRTPRRTCRKTSEIGTGFRHLSHAVTCCPYVSQNRRFCDTLS